MYPLTFPSFLCFPNADDGRAWFWGSIQRSTFMFGLFRRISSTWVPISPKYNAWADLTFLDVATGYHAIAFITSEHKLVTMGYNNEGNLTCLLGRAFNPWDTPGQPWPVEVVLTSPMASVAYTRVFGGSWNFFALSAAGNLIGWGMNFYGQMAQNPSTDPHFCSPIDISLPEIIVDVALSSYHVLAVSGAGNVYAWSVYPHFGFFRATHFLPWSSPHLSGVSELVEVRLLASIIRLFFLDASALFCPVRLVTHPAMFA